MFDDRRRLGCRCPHGDPIKGWRLHATGRGGHGRGLPTPGVWTSSLWNCVMSSKQVDSPSVCWGPCCALQGVNSVPRSPPRRRQWHLLVRVSVRRCLSVCLAMQQAMPPPTHLSNAATHTRRCTHILVSRGGVHRGGDAGSDAERLGPV